MISQILGFSALFILVFGGVIGAVAKFTLHGNVQAEVRNRMAEERMENAFGQTGAIPDTESSVTSGRADRKAACRVDERCRSEKKIFQSAS